MTTRSKGRTQSAKKKSSSSRSRSSASSSRSRQKAPQKGSVGFGDYLHMFIRSKAFVPIITILVIGLIIGLDFLFSMNDFNKFFTILGVELLIALVCWIIITLIGIGKHKSEQDRA
ncbi:MAG: hypothetical protein J6X33_08510 [Clostridiales bacterium]|nr:hypothetical protein [Clostridiales bacterium]